MKDLYAIFLIVTAFFLCCLSLLNGLAVDFYTLIFPAFYLLQNYSEAVIAFCALSFSVYQARKIFEEKKLSARPEITHFTNFHDSHGASKTRKSAGKTAAQNAAAPPVYWRRITLKNAGLGPARILSTKIFYEDTLIAENSAEALIKNIQQLANDMGFDLEYWEMHCWRENHFATSQETLSLLQLNLKYRSEDEIEAFDQFFKNIRVEVIYESLYAERHSYSSQALSTL